ncbi:MAG: cohesin domain-containing protein [Mahellales bacterium]
MDGLKRSRKYLVFSVIAVACAVVFSIIGIRIGTNPGMEKGYQRANIYCVVLPERVHTGEAGQMQVFISGAHDIYGVSLEAFYDPQYISIESINWGTFMKGGQSQPITPVNTMDKEMGRASAACLLTGDVNGISGEGCLLTIDFTAKGQGVVSVKEGTMDDKHPTATCLFTFSLGTSDLKLQPYTFKAFDMEITPYP